MTHQDLKRKAVPFYGIHWFRRDLRVAGNAALRWNRERHGGRVVGLFCFDSKFLGRPDFSANRFAFFMATLQSLREELQSIGSDLLVLDCQPDEAFTHLCDVAPPNAVSFNRDYEPFARARDERVSTLLEKKLKVEVRTERDHLVFEPEEVVKDDGTFYKVYTPYSKQWLKHFATAAGVSRIAEQRAGLKYMESRLKGGAAPALFSLTWNDLLGKDVKKFPDACAEFVEKNAAAVTVPLPEAGSLAAYKALKEFEPKLNAYGEARDFPAVAGTSKLSIYFKNGSLTTAQVMAYMGLKSGKYLSELIWREFYYSILWHCPRVEKEAFLEKYKDLPWENDKMLFKAWKEGRTGYPIVDAGMRELATTGWMHNRVRMIVASFLTKDLLIDWRWGERYFMEQLLDGDLAPNNGGWQWASSTGCDPQPYFRIFNPELQSERFDGDGAYIRAFVPELAAVSAKEIHNPDDATRRRCGYPEPVVEHAARKVAALAMFDGTKS
jgi:deoxyribodipyrimidine photo-lyase